MEAKEKMVREYYTANLDQHKVELKQGLRYWKIMRKLREAVAVIFTLYVLYKKKQKNKKTKKFIKPKWGPRLCAQYIS